MNADELRATTRATIDVDEAIPDLLPLAERSLRRALEPGGDLDHVALRVGRRVFIRVEPLRELLGMTPESWRSRNFDDGAGPTLDMDEAGPASPAAVTTTDRTGPGHNEASHIRAV